MYGKTKAAGRGVAAIRQKRGEGGRRAAQGCRQTGSRGEEKGGGRHLCMSTSLMLVDTWRDRSSRKARPDTAASFATKSERRAMTSTKSNSNISDSGSNRSNNNKTRTRGDKNIHKCGERSSCMKRRARRAEGQQQGGRREVKGGRRAAKGGRQTGSRGEEKRRKGGAGSSREQKQQQQQQQQQQGAAATATAAATAEGVRDGLTDVEHHTVSLPALQCKTKVI